MYILNNNRNYFIPEHLAQLVVTSVSLSLIVLIVGCLPSITRFVIWDDFMPIIDVMYGVFVTNGMGKLAGGAKPKCHNIMI